MNTAMKTSSVKTTTTRKPAEIAVSDKRRRDRSTLAAFYIFGATLLLSLIYFLSLVLFL